MPPDFAHFRTGTTSLVPKLACWRQWLGPGLGSGTWLLSATLPHRLYLFHLSPPFSLQDLGISYHLVNLEVTGLSLID